MALDLLTDDAWEGKIIRLYRHDCESFAWVLLWICCRYDDGKEINNPPSGELITHDYTQCFLQKHSILSRLPHNAATPSYESAWDAARAFLGSFVGRRMAREMAHLRDAKPEEPTVNELFQSCRKAIKGLDLPLVPDK